MPALLRYKLIRLPEQPCSGFLFRSDPVPHQPQHVCACPHGMSRTRVETHRLLQTPKCILKALGGKALG
jgi:hypothetical protein